MKESFPLALTYVLRSEGGYVNNPHDKGGATNHGITQRVYNAWRVNHGNKLRSVALIDDEEVASIYRYQYWDAVRGDELPAGVDYAVFDAAVNSGPVHAAKWLQLALGGIKVDGVIGSITINRANAMSRVILCEKFNAIRFSFLRRLTDWKYFGGGWSHRMADVQQQAKEMSA
jgi:lysozyme family protein